MGRAGRKGGTFISSGTHSHHLDFLFCLTRSGAYLLVEESIVQIISLGAFYSTSTVAAPPRTADRRNYGAGSSLGEPPRAPRDSSARGVCYAQTRCPPLRFGSPLDMLDRALALQLVHGKLQCSRADSQSVKHAGALFPSGAKNPTLQCGIDVPARARCVPQLSKKWALSFLLLAGRP